MDKYSDLLNRSMGILVFDKGVIIQAEIIDESRTAIVLAPNIQVGEIVQDHETGLWYYDSDMRSKLGIKENPRFETDARTGNALEDLLPDLSQINAFARRIIAERSAHSPNGTG